MSCLLTNKVFTKVLLIGDGSEWRNVMFDYVNRTYYQPKVIITRGLDYALEKMDLTSPLFEFTPDVVFISPSTFCQFSEVEIKILNEKLKSLKTTLVIPLSASCFTK